MGKTLTEQQKADRAAKAIVRKQQAELGPLFADQAEAPDVGQLLLERRMGWSSMQEHLSEVMSGLYIGETITEAALRRLAQQHLAPWFEGLDEYRKRTYPKSPSYGSQFWSARLTTTERVVYRWLRVPDASKSLGVRLVADGEFPPDGWTPPLTRADLPRTPPRCHKCRYYHEPNQVCVEMDPNKETPADEQDKHSMDRL